MIQSLSSSTFTFLLLSNFFLPAKSANNPTLQHINLLSAFHPASSHTNKITLTSPDFFVHVDFVDFSNSGHLHTSANTTGTMALALYTNETFLTGNCQGFIPYNCSLYDCIEDSSYTRHISFPFFEIEGYIIHTPLFMDYKSFFSYAARVNYLTNCSLNAGFGRDKVNGLIGMGTEGFGVHNYVSEQYVFSIYFNDNGTKAELSFDCDKAKGKTNENELEFDANGNWGINVSTISLVYSNLTNFLRIAKDTKMIFDINSDFIGLPSKIFDKILIVLTKSFNITCKTTGLITLCSYLGNIEQLPTINIHGIIITPSMYLERNKDNLDTFSLLLKRLSKQSTFKYHQRVTAPFMHSIILGRPFLRQYYVCFKGREGENQIAIYKKVKFGPDDTTLWMPFILMGVIVLIPLSCFLIFLVKGLFSKSPSEAPKSFSWQNRINTKVMTRTPLLPPKNALI